MRMAAGMIFCACIGLALPAHAEEEKGIEIRDVEESPGVLHLVPWRLPRDQLQEEPPVDNTRFDSVLEPVDDRAHRRHMRYRQKPGELLQKLSGPETDGSSG